MKRWDIKRVCIAAVCIALCYVLPVALHGVALGSALSPMHIPVLLCGFVWKYSRKLLPTLLGEVFGTGIIGGLLGGWVVSLFGWYPIGTFSSLVASTIGAIVLLCILSLFTNARRYRDD